MTQAGNETFGRWEPWMDSALCAQVDPELFFPEGKGTQTREVKQVCAACDVITECLEYALRNNERIGVWGGKSVLERARIRRARNAA